MRIHTNLTRDQVTAVLPTGVTLHVFNEHGSRSHPRAFEVQLTSDNGRTSRWTNSGTHGAGYVKAASWDEWGIFLGALFRLDQEARIPQIYEDASDFEYRTNYRYTKDFTVADQHAYHKWQWNFGEAKCAGCW